MTRRLIHGFDLAGARVLAGFLTFSALVLSSACGPGSESRGGSEAQAPADVIWHGGPILTMDPEAPRAEAVAVRDGRIVAVGDEAEVSAGFAGSETRRVDLEGQALLPGFVDAHGHFSTVGLQAVSANLLPPPDGPARSIPEIQAILREFMEDQAEVVEDFGVVIGFNYDDSQLEERRHPTRQELDAVTTEVPVMIIHQSGHLGVYNSLALEQVGITAESENPQGGTIYREADGRTPAGLLDENAHIGALIALLPGFTDAQTDRMYRASQEIYLANGYTTVQDGRTDPGTLAQMERAANAGLFEVDLVAYPDLTMSEGSPLLSGPLMSRSYTRRFRIGGVKISLDGSPQGKTAWFTEPYFQPPQGAGPEYRGVPIFASDEEPIRQAMMAYEKGWQLLAHANGDAAIDQFIRMIRAASEAYPDAAFPAGDPRPVLIHGQYLRADQIPALAELGIIPSLYPMHTFYWGDWHRSSVAGPERAEFISPTRAALDAGLNVTIHHDAPVTFPNALRVLHSAVNRVTRSGYILGPDQRLTVEEALRAMTLAPARQHFEEDTKGSIEVGKLADFVILSADPTAVPPESLLELQVRQTVKEGRVVYP